MREAKFRAWDKENREMLFDHIEFEMRSLGYGQETCVKCSQKTPCKREVGFIGWLVDCDAWVMMQYTGLKDKNGKEIYEGDIVKRFNTDEGSEIRWRQDCCAFDFRETTSYMLHPEYANNWYEVIGNIYENPELLK